VGSRDFLSHGRQKSLRVEESSHPETGGTSLEQPGRKLSISVQQIGEPETQGSRLPRNLQKITNMLTMAQRQKYGKIFLMKGTVL